MKVILTEQSLDRLESSLQFHLDDLQIPIEKVKEIKIELISRAESLLLIHLQVSMNYISLKAEMIQKDERITEQLTPNFPQ